MTLNEYFEKADGVGVLATSDSWGNVDAALYARPHFVDEQTVEFTMADRLSLHNLEGNHRAAYLFVEKGEGFRGRRLHLTLIRKEDDPRKIAAARRGPLPPDCLADAEAKYRVQFHVDLVRDLTDEMPVTAAEERREARQCCGEPRVR